MVSFARPRGRASHRVLFATCWKGIQMRHKDRTRAAHYEGPRNVVTVREVSAYLRVHPSTVYKMLKNNQIPAFHVGSDWRFNIEAIDHWRLQQGKPGD
jgi:excisionase family DNA binding protein